MTSTITVGRRLIPLEHIALIEPFDPATQPKMKSDRPFQARIVLVDRESVLTEEALADFAGRHGFRALAEDGIATNPAIHFNVEAFAPADGFRPTRPYQSRLMWRDQAGQMQSKLLLAEPETVLAVVVRGAMEAKAIHKTKPRARRRRKAEPEAEPS
jgi:hypothetical protein